MVIHRAGFQRVVSLAVPPGVLTVGPGDKIRVTTEWDYIGPAMSGRVSTSLYRPTTIDPHDDIARVEKPFSYGDSPDPGIHCSIYVDITVPSGYTGTNFGLMSKLIGIPGPAVQSPWYDNVIEIVGGVPEFTDLRITSYDKV